MNANELQLICDAHTKRICELERLLCIESAISLHNFRRYEAAMGCGPEGFDPYISWDDLPEEQRKAIIEELEASEKQTDFFRDELTELLWEGIQD